MALKTVDVTVTADGRDKGKVFHLTEMPAKPAEKWGTRAMLALSRSKNISLPPGIEGAGMAGVFIVGMSMIAGVEFGEAEPLMDEMFQCVQIIPPGGVIRPLQDKGRDGDDIEEVATRIMLRGELFKLHVGFSLAEAGPWLIGKLNPDPALEEKPPNT